MSSSYKLFETVYGLGEVSINKLIDNGAKTIHDLKHKPKFYNTLKQPTKDYLLYYDELQERIPRDEVIRHKETIDRLVNAGGDFYRIDIVGSFRRGEQYCGDIDVLFTTKLNYNPTLEYISAITSILSAHGYLIKTLKKGHKVMNGIAKLTPYSKARRVDLFFSAPDVYAFALLTKTGDVAFNKSLRACIKEKNPDYTLSELGIRMNGSNIGKKNDFGSEDRILDYIGIVGRKEPEEMVGSVSCKKRGEKRSGRESVLSGLTRRSGKTRRSVKKRKRESEVSVKLEGEASTVSTLTQTASRDSEATYE